MTSSATGRGFYAPPLASSRGEDGFVLSEDLPCVGLILLVVAEHLAFGGNRTDIALSFAVAHAGLLGYVLSRPWGQVGLQLLRGWPTTAALFGLTILGIALSLAPLPQFVDIWSDTDGPSRAAVYPMGVIIEIIKLSDLGTTFTLAAVLASDKRRALSVLNFFMLGSIVFGGVCLLLEALSPIDVFGWPKPKIGLFRVSGLFSSPNTAATVFGVNALIAAAGVLRALTHLRRRRLRSRAAELVQGSAAEIVALLLNLECLFLSGSRGGIAAFFLALALFVIWRGRTLRNSGLPVLVVLGSVVAIAFLSGGVAIHRYLSGAYLSDQRLSWDAWAWRMFLGSPVEGYGPGSFGQVMGTLGTPTNYATLSWAGAAHNVYLQWLSEEGLLPSIPMAATLIWIIAQSFMHLPRTGAAATWRRALICCAALVLGHSLVEYSLQEPSIAVLFSTILGLGLGFASQEGVEADAFA